MLLRVVPSGTSEATLAPPNISVFLMIAIDEVARHAESIIFDLSFGPFEGRIDLVGISRQADYVQTHFSNSEAQGIQVNIHSKVSRKSVTFG